MDTFDYFRQICKIPRSSGNEEGMRQYLLNWAEENGFEAFRDESGNIIVRCPATEGFENRKPVCLQGHMDMVCVKDSGVKHNFDTDPIEVIEEGDIIRANGTSLGGDNGIAVAMTMALFTDKTACHGPLEALFTYSEETGMNGAFNIEAKSILSRKMINLDSEEEGVIYIGCAGGIDLQASYSAKQVQIPSGYRVFKISVGGLKGGHSGGEIHHQRLNAVKAVSRMVCTCIEKGVDIRICSIEGGTRRNVIPSSATCVFACMSDPANIIDESFGRIFGENKYEEPDFCYTLEESKASLCFDGEDSSKIAKLLCAVPHGVHKFSKAVEGVVETSDNLAIVGSDSNGVNFEVSVRSLIDSAKTGFVYEIKYIFESFGCQCEIGEDYPSWAPDPKSKLAEFCAKAYREKTGKEPVLTSIHAGLECGVINSRIEGMDSVSMGPDLFDVHSTKEHLSISSVKRMYEFVKHLVQIID